MNRTTLVALYRLAKRHLFTLLCVTFGFFMLFVGDHSFVSILSLEAQEASLRKEIKQYQDSVKNFVRRNEELSVGSEELERYAREKMKMHRENEDLYLIDD